jgi:hypothetical protein
MNDREAFEANWQQRHGVPMNTRPRDDGRYGYHILQYEWEAWKAATQRQQSHIEELEQEAKLMRARNERLEAEVAELRKTVDAEWKLDKPAKIGGGTFGAGVSARLAIQAAQRLYEHTMKEDAMSMHERIDEERKRRALWDLVHGSIDAAIDAARKENT